MPSETSKEIVPVIDLSVVTECKKDMRNLHESGKNFEASLISSTYYLNYCFMMIKFSFREF